MNDIFESLPDAFGNGDKNKLVPVNIDSLQSALFVVVPGSATASVELQELHSNVKNLTRDLRAILALIEESVIEHIETTGQDIELSNGERWYIGKGKVTKSIDDQGVLEAILTATGGDLSQVVSGANGVLSASPWKIAATRAIIGEELFAKLFKTETTVDLKTGKVKKELKTTNDNFRMDTGSRAKAVLDAPPPIQPPPEAGWLA